MGSSFWSGFTNCEGERSRSNFSSRFGRECYCCVKLAASAETRHFGQMIVASSNNFEPARHRADAGGSGPNWKWPTDAYIGVSKKLSFNGRIQIWTKILFSDQSGKIISLLQISKESGVGSADGKPTLIDVAGDIENSPPTTRLSTPWTERLSVSRSRFFGPRMENDRDFVRRTLFDKRIIKLWLMWVLKIQTGRSISS